MSENIKSIPANLQRWYESGNEMYERFCEEVNHAIEAARQESATEVADLRRQLAEAQASRNELKYLIKSLVTQQVDRKKNPVHIEPQNHPDHGHEVIGIWDDDNGDLAGKPCALCAIWNKAIEEANRTVINDYSSLDTLLAAKSEEIIAQIEVMRSHIWPYHDECCKTTAHNVIDNIIKSIRAKGDA